MANEGFDNSTQASLIGNDNSIAESLAQEPEPTQDQPGPSTVTSTDAGADTQPESGTEEAQPEKEVTPETKEGEETVLEGEGEEEEAADDWLPDEQEKVFPIDVLARYAERYGYSLEQLQNDANLQRLMKDTINGDIARRQQATQAEEIEQEPVESPVSPEEQQRRYAEQHERQQAYVGDVVGQMFDQNLVKQMGLDLYKSFGVDVSKVDDPDTKALVESAPKVGQTLARHMVSGVYAVLPHLLLLPDPNTGQSAFMRMVEAVMPGLTEMHERSSYQMQWARAAHEVGGNLPAYGTPEFTQALEEAAEKIPNFDEIVYRDKQGNVLRPHEQAYRKYVMLAKAISASKKKPATGPSPKRQVQGTDQLAEFIKAENARGF